MRVLVVGASGVIGTRLVPQLRQGGHEVIGSCNSPGKMERLRALGAEPIMLNALDQAAVREAVANARPDAIIYQSTALANARFGRSLDKTFAQTNRLRTEGTDNLIAAALAAGVRRFVAQSFASFRYAREGGPIKSEDDRLDPAPAKSARQTHAAMTHLDQAVTAFGGIALRYGGFYGPDDEGLVAMVRKRFMPVIGDGSGVTSFVHLDDAAAAAVLALDHDGPAIYNITDDEPAAASEWIPALARVVGAKPPRHIPLWLIRAVAGQGILMMAQARGAANAKAKRELGWTLRYPTWRQGFPATYGGSAPASSAELPQDNVQR